MATESGRRYLSGCIDLLDKYPQATEICVVSEGLPSIQTPHGRTEIPIAKEGKWTTQDIDDLVELLNVTGKGVATRWDQEDIHQGNGDQVWTMNLTGENTHRVRIHYLLCENGTGRALFIKRKLVDTKPSLNEQEIKCLTTSCGLVIVGGPVGAGKTTLIEEMTRNAATERMCSVSVVSKTAEIDVRLESGQSVVRIVIGADAKSACDAIDTVMAAGLEVIICDDVADAKVFSNLLTAAENGLLVICGMRARHAYGVVATLHKWFAGERLVATMSAVSDVLCGVVSLERIVNADKNGWVVVAEILAGQRMMGLPSMHVNAVRNLIREIDTFNSLGTESVINSCAFRTHTAQITDLVVEGKLTADVACQHVCNPEQIPL